jgi:hypothetical protein
LAKCCGTGQGRGATKNLTTIDLHDFTPDLWKYTQ